MARSGQRNPFDIQGLSRTPRGEGGGERGNKNVFQEFFSLNFQKVFFLLAKATKSRVCAYRDIHLVVVAAAAISSWLLPA